MSETPAETTDAPVAEGVADENLTPKQKKVRAAEKRVTAARAKLDKLTGAQKAYDKAVKALEWVKAMPEDTEDDGVTVPEDAAAPAAPVEESPAEQTAESVEEAVTESPAGEPEQTGLAVDVEPTSTGRSRGRRG